MNTYHAHSRAAARRALPLALIALLSSCASTEHGTKIERDAIARIQKGVTTRADAERILGQPAHVIMLPEGKRLLHYSYSSTSSGVTKGGVATAIATSALTVLNPLAGMAVGDAPVGTRTATRTQALQLLVNAAGVVEDYELTDGTATTTSGLAGASTTVAPTPSVAAKEGAP